MKLEDCRFIIVYGGSFDPPHWAHVKLPELVRGRLGADAVAYVPAAQSPHKMTAQPTDAAHRLAMLRRALDDQPRSIIVTDELDRAAKGEPSYTVDTLEALRERLGPDVEMRLLIGTDQAAAFDNWHQPQRIIELADPVVMLRPPDDAQSWLESLSSDKARQFWGRRLVPAPQVDVSATEIRRRIAAGEALEELVPEPVARYIEEHALYRD